MQWSFAFPLLLLALGQQQPPAMATPPIPIPTHANPTPTHPTPPAHPSPNPNSNHQQTTSYIGPSYYNVTFVSPGGLDLCNSACQASNSNGGIAMPKDAAAITAIAQFTNATYPGALTPAYWVGLLWNLTNFVYFDGTVLTNWSYPISFSPVNSIDVTTSGAGQIYCVAMSSPDAGTNWYWYVIANCDIGWMVLCEVPPPTYYISDINGGDSNVGGFNKACSANRTGGGIALPNNAAATSAAAASITNAYSGVNGQIPELFIGLSCDSTQCTSYDGTVLTSSSYQPWGPGGSLSATLQYAASHNNVACIAIKEHGNDWIWVPEDCTTSLNILCQV